MKIRCILCSEFLSHPNKALKFHILNMINDGDDEITRQIKLFHDIAKLKQNFQKYINNPNDKITDKNHSLLSAYIFLLNSTFDELSSAFGFLSIVSHHGDVENFSELIANNKNFGKYFELSHEFDFWDEVVNNALNLEIYANLKTDKNELSRTIKDLYIAILMKKNKFDYTDFIEFKKLYSSLIYADKFEAIFSEKKEDLKPVETNELDTYISKLSFNQKRDDFRHFVLSNFDKNHRLFTLTAPTGYGKTLTALNFALKFKKERLIYVLPFTSIIDQTHEIISKIYENNKGILVYKAHHKTAVDEDTPEDRYSKVKFLMDSFSGNFNVTTLYQFIFTIFGNKNKDNVKFNQLKNSVVIIDEAQAIPYEFRVDFMRLCEIISQKLDTIFIFMSATMPIMGDKFKEISNLSYFKEQNRYVLKWLDINKNEENLIEKITQTAKNKNTLVVVNTIKKAQQLFLKFAGKFECYSLNGYMHDTHKREVIKGVKEAINLNKNGCGKPILLISTQSIEAGVDLDFDIGFRETAPISSIIQTAGRINRNFGDQGVLYVFEDICGYSDPIYGDLKTISDAILKDTLLQNDVEEKDILSIVTKYFKSLKEHLERAFVEQEMKELAFYDINEKINKAMNDEYKMTVIIEPRSEFIKEFEAKIFAINADENLDKFARLDIFKDTIKQISKFSINVSKIDADELNLRAVRALKEVYYLPFGDTAYNEKFGLKKDMDFNALNEAFD